MSAPRRWEPKQPAERVPFVPYNPTPVCWECLKPQAMHSLGELRKCKKALAERIADPDDAHDA